MKRAVFFLIISVFMIGLCQAGAAQETSKAEASGQAAAEPDVVRMKILEPFSYCCLEMTGSYEQHSLAFMNLYSEIGAQGLAPKGEPFGVYRNDPESTPEDELQWEIGLPVAEGTEVKEPLKLKTWKFVHLVSKKYEGAFDKMDGVYGEMMVWMGENGYTIAGPIMEKFLNMPSQNEKGEWIGRVEILIPVQKGKPGSE